MNVSISVAKSRLPELVRRAEGGEEVVLTRHGRPAVVLKPLVHTRREWTNAELEERRRILLEISEDGSKRALPGPDAARAADYLYDDDGLPD